MRSTSVVLVVAMMITLLAGCSPEAMIYANRPFCDPTLRLTVGAGLTPTFSWNDGCRVWTLRVERAATNAVAWTVGKDDESLDSPIVYGQLPTGAGQFGAAEALQPGVEYRAVLVQRSNGGRVLAETHFTP